MDIDTRAIFFDLDGTLVSFTREYGEILESSVEAVEGADPDGWVEQYNETFFELFESFEPDPVRETFDRIDGSADSSALASEILAHELEFSCTPDGVHADLERLGADYQLGVLTNGVPAWQHQKLVAHDLDQYFDAFVASYEVGVHKPHPDIFQAAVGRLEADEYAMVGDSDGDVQGARDVGWSAWQYESGGFEALPDAFGWTTD